MGSLSSARRAHRGPTKVGIRHQFGLLQTVRSWVQSGNAPPWPACAGLSLELRCWRLQVGNLTIDSVGRLWRRRSPPSEGLQLLVPVKERHELIRRFHDSLFAGHLGVTHTVFRLLDRVFLARSTTRRPNVHCIVHSLPGAKVTVPVEGSHGTCGTGP